MAITNFNAKNGLSVGTGSINVIDNSANATFASAMTTGSLGVGTPVSSTTRMFISGSSVSSDSVAIIRAGTATPTGKLLDVRNNSNTTVASVDYLGNISANTGSFSGDLSVSGNLTILGSSSIINSTIVSIGDNIVQLNTQTPTQSTGGLWVADTTSGETGSLIWNSTSNRWMGGLSGNEINLVTTGSTDNLYNKTIPITGTPSNNISGGTTGGLGYFDASTNLKSTAAGTSNQLLQSNGSSAPSWVSPSTVISNNSIITGSGTTNYVSKFSSGNAISNSVIYDDGTNVGIGTSSPSTFAASRSLVIGQSAVTEQNALKIFGGNNANRAPVISLFRAGNSEGIISQIVTNSMLAFGSGGGIASYTDAALIAYSTLFLGSAGNVGIGTSNFGSKLYVSGSSTASTPTMTVKEGVASPTGGVGVFDVQNSAGTSLFFVSGSGNVGIGTSTPATNLHVYPKIAGESTEIRLANDGTASGNPTFTLYRNASDYSSISHQPGGSGLTISTTHPAAAPIAFRTGATLAEAMRITGAGNVGIGTSLIDAKLVVNGATVLSGTLNPPTDNNAAYTIGSTSKRWSNIVSTALSGSLTRLSDGTTPYLLAGTNVSISTGSNGQVTISSASPAGTVTGTGTSGYHSKFTGANTIANGVIYDDGTNIGIGTTLLDSKFVVNGASVFSGSVNPDGDATRDLGSSSKRWNNFYAANISGSLTASNVSAGQVVVAGTGGVLSGTNNFVWDNANVRVGIGATSPGATLQVSGSSTSTATTVILKGGATSQTGPILDVQDNNSSTIMNVSGSVVETTVPVRVPNGTATAPAFSFTQGTTTGIYRRASGQLLNFSVSGNQAMGIDTNGLVGINVTATSSPSAVLHVNGNSTASTATALFRAGTAAPTGPVLDVQNSSSTSLLVVSGSGNVGIGTVAPLQKLDVAGSLRVTGNFYRPDNAGIALTLGNGTESHFQDLYVFYNAAGGTEFSRLNSTGLGIGATPSSRLHVSGSSTSATPVAILQAGVTTPTGKVLDVRNQGGTTVASVDHLGNISANTGSFSGDLSVSGNLTVLGSSSIINSTIVSIGDNIVQLNTQSPTQSTGGVYVADTTASTTGSLIWSSTDDRWKAGFVGLETNVVLTGSTDNLYNKTIPITGASLNNISGGTTGGVGYFDGSTNLKSTSAGTANQLLQSNGSSAPSWVSQSSIITSNNIITGSGTANYVSKFSSGNAVTNSVIYDDGTNVGIGTATIGDKLSVNGTMSVTGSYLNPGSDNSTNLGSSSKRWSNVYATSYVTSAATTGATYSKSFSSGEAGKITATVGVPSAGTKTFTVSVSNGASLFDVGFVVSESGFSVAKKYTVSSQFGTSSSNVVSFKTIDTGPYSGNDLTVTFTKTSSTVTTCTISHNNISTINVALTIDIAATSSGGSTTTVTLF